MTEPFSWPRRYEVRIRTRRGDAVFSRVLSWYGPDKAKAMAVAAYEEGADRSGDDAVADVEATELGPAERGPTGLVVITKGDLFDRMEF